MFRGRVLHNASYARVLLQARVGAAIRSPTKACPTPARYKTWPTETTGQTTSRCWERLAQLLEFPLRLHPSARPLDVVKVDYVDCNYGRANRWNPPKKKKANDDGIPCSVTTGGHGCIFCNMWMPAVSISHWLVGWSSAVWSRYFMLFPYPTHISLPTWKWQIAQHSPLHGNWKPE